MRSLSEVPSDPDPPAAAGIGFSADSLEFIQFGFWMTYVTGAVEIVIGCVIGEQCDSNLLALKRCRPAHT